LFGLVLSGIVGGHLFDLARFLLTKFGLWDAELLSAAELVILFFG